jgi:ArsR family transcriptional regulator
MWTALTGASAGALRVAGGLATLSSHSVAGVKRRGGRTATVKAPPSAPATPTPIKISEDTVSDLTGVFKLLADKSRLKIVLALAQDGELHVSALCDLLDQSQPAVSHHLTLMRMGGLVSFVRVGKNNYYRLASGYIRDLFEQFFADAGNGHKALQFDDFALTFKRK